jgi:hypothetical protein
MGVSGFSFGRKRHNSAGGRREHTRGFKQDSHEGRVTVDFYAGSVLGRVGFR